VKTPEIEIGQAYSIKWDSILDFSYYNLTVTAQVEDAIVVRQGFLRVTKPPKIVVKANPESPIINKEVVFNASESILYDASGNITNYEWRIYKPGVEDPEKERPTIRVSGSDKSAITYAFNQTGNWTVILDITWSLPEGSLMYESYRSASSAFRTTLNVKVTGEGGGEGGGFDMQWIIAIVIIVLVLVVVGLFVWRRRQVKPPAG